MIRRINRISRWVPWLCGWVLALGLMSCIKDDLSECGVEVRFRYTYNMVETDAFRQEVDRVALYVFDAGDRLVAQQEAYGAGEADDFSMRLPFLPAGDYTFVAWANSTDRQGEYADFDFPALEIGDSKETLTARLPREADGITHQSPLNSLLNGTLTASVGDGPRSMTIDMMKCTHTLRIILMPIQGGQTLDEANYSFVIADRNGWLAHNAEPHKDDWVAYRPYYQELSVDTSADYAGDDAAISSAVVTELNTSRLIYDDEPRLIIRDTRGGQEMLNINLTWLLSLKAIGEHRADWSDQEYLDRQDEYAMTFFIDADNGTWMQNRILVNGWVLSLEEIEL